MLGVEGELALCYSALPEPLKADETLVYLGLTKLAQAIKDHDQLTQEELKGHAQAVAAGKMKYIKGLNDLGTPSDCE